MRIVVVDAGSFTAHYDANLCHALAARGHRVSLDTSEFLFEQVRPLGGYEVRNRFFRLLQRRPALGSRAALRRMIKAGLYPLEMLRWAASVGREAPDVVHVQWSLLPFWDERLFAHLQKRGSRVVATVHDVEPLPDTGGTAVGSARLYRRADALIVHSDYSRGRLLSEFDVDPFLTDVELREQPSPAVVGVDDEGVGPAVEACASDGRSTGIRKRLHIVDGGHHA